MRIRVGELMAKISDNGWTKDLQGCQTLKERYQKLVSFLPEIRKLFPSIQNQLFFHIQRDFGINLGVCEFFEIKGLKYKRDNDNSEEIVERDQYCTHGDRKDTCSCRVPQLFCVICGRNSEVGQEEQTEIVRILASQ